MQGETFTNQPGKRFWDVSKLFWGCAFSGLVHASNSLVCFFSRDTISCSSCCLPVELHNLCSCKVPWNLPVFSGFCAAIPVCALSHARQKSVSQAAPRQTRTLDAQVSVWFSTRGNSSGIGGFLMVVPHYTGPRNLLPNPLPLCDIIK